jgi:YegS/Rv2252/BmrU family lipid kinase
MTQSIFAVINPVAGQSSTQAIRQALTRQFSRNEYTIECYETTGDEHVPGIVRNAVKRGFTLVVAAGGDGTVSGVSSGLVYTQVPLGILPMGTANVLAQELEIPQNLEQAVALLNGEHRIRTIDAMRVQNRFFVQQVGIGIDALSIRDTSRRLKRIFGSAAYMWNGVRQMAGFQPRRFAIIADGAHIEQRASQVLIANGSLLGFKFLRWGPDIFLDDKHLTVCIVNARTLADYTRIGWHFVRHQQKRSRGMRYLTAERFISVSSDKPLPVQADGEIIQETPVQVRVVPQAVRVIVPPA